MVWGTVHYGGEGTEIGPEGNYCTAAAVRMQQERMTSFQCNFFFLNSWRGQPTKWCNIYSGRSSDSSIYLISMLRICLQDNFKSYKANSQYWPSITMSICYSVIPTLTNTVLDPQYWKRKQPDNPFPDKVATQEKTETTYNVQITKIGFGLLINQKS